ncbi:histidine kinase [Angustibacter peucedani]
MSVLPGVVRRWRRARAFVARISPRARDVTILLITLGAGLGYTFSLDGKAADGWVFTVLVLSCAAAVALWWRRRFPVVVTLVTLVIAVITALPVAVAFAVLTLTIRRRDRVLAMVVGLCFATDVVRELVTGSNAFTTLAGSALFWSALVAIGAYIGARRDLVVSLRQRAETAEAERELRAEQARLAERNRIAREMHDVLAHKVSLIALHAGALEVNADAGPEQVERTAALVRTTAREALDDLRGVLGVLRTDAKPDGADLAPQPGLADVASLVESSRAAGVAVELECRVEGTPPDVLGRTAHRVVQESLTNVHKHARSASTSVLLDGAAGRGLDVVVRNKVPVAAGSLLPGSGMGLVGLAERVALVGGTLESGRTDDGGWRVRAHLPWGGADEGGAA